MTTAITLTLPNAFDALESYDQNTASLQRAKDAAADLLQLDPKTLTAEQDAQLETYLVKARRTLEQMQERRTPLTRALDAVRTQFVQLEAQLDPKKKDSIPAALQAKRDDYAARIRAQQQQQLEQAQAAQQKVKELEAQQAPLDQQMEAVQQAAELIAAPLVSAPKGRTGIEARITHPRAYVALLALFLEREERTMEQLQRMTLGQLATYAERLALSTGEVLDIEGLTYVETFKTVAL